MRKTACCLLAALLLFVLGCSGRKTTDRERQKDPWDKIAEDIDTSDREKKQGTIEGYRSSTVTLDGEEYPFYGCVYDVLSDGTARLTLIQDWKYLGAIPEAVDGKTVSTLGRDLFSEEYISSGSITIPDSVIAVEGNPFGCEGMVSKIVVSASHPTLEVVDGVLFSKPDHRLICACLRTNDEYHIPEGTKRIEDHAFRHAAVCYGTIFIPDSVTELGQNPFAFCNRSKETGPYRIELSETHPTLQIVDDMLYSKPDRRLVCYANSEAERGARGSRFVEEGTRAIDDFAFYRHENRFASLEIYIPDSVRTMGINPFYGRDVQIVLTGSRYFQLEDGLLYDKMHNRLVSALPTSLSPDVIVRGGTEVIGAYAFAGSEAVQTVSLPDSVREVGDMAFCDNTKITTCNIPQGVRRIGVCAFAGCWQLETKMALQGGVVIEAGAFGPMAAGIGAGVTELTITGKGGAVIGNSAFSYCRGLTKVMIDAGEPYIGSQAFSHTGLEKVSFGEGLVSLGGRVFMECGGLRGYSLVLPASLRYIGDLTNDMAQKYNETFHAYMTEYICTMDIHVTAGSYAEEYCRENDIPYKYAS